MTIEDSAWLPHRREDNAHCTLDTNLRRLLQPRAGRRDPVPGKPFLQRAFPDNKHRFVHKKQDQPVVGLEAADWVARVFNAKGLGDPGHDAEFERYRDQIWVGQHPGRPGRTGFKTFPEDTHRQVLGIPVNIRPGLKKPNGA